MLNNQTKSSPEEVKLQQKMAKVKSKTHLERLYMIDVVERGKKEVELVMHFVN